MNSSALSPALWVVLASTLSAQTLFGELTPNPAPPGTPVRLQVTNLGAGPAVFHDSCLIRRVTSGSPDGPEVWAPAGCGDIVFALDPGRSRDETWDLTNFRGHGVAPGSYWLHVRHESSIPGDPSSSAWCVMVSETDVPRAALTVTGPAPLGGLAPLRIDAPGHAWGAYVAAASFSTNRGFPLGNLHAALDDDLLFSLSWPVPSPDLFVAFQGGLGADGSSSSLGVLVPAIADLSGTGIYVQALVYDPAGPEDPPLLTNPVSLVFGL